MVDKGNRERGLRAALHNPRVSEQAKQRDREILEKEFGEHFEATGVSNMATEQEISPEMEDEEYIEEPPTALRAKQTSGLGSSTAESTSTSKKTRSSSFGAAVSSSTAHDIEEKHSSNVIRGLKAAISNPNVSEKAKEKDRQKLRDLGESV
ncbi:hypothetical protein OQA88_4277 [Cercophora sp. LCS_1]